MRRIAMLCLAFSLTSCGYKTWWNPPFAGGSTPNMPNVNSENMERVVGRPLSAEPITTEPGDIWPGPLKPAPTLQDLEAQGLQPEQQLPAPGSPNRDRLAPMPPQNPSSGSSSPPPNLSPAVPQGTPAPQGAPPAPLATQPPPRTSGQIVQTPEGAGVTTGGGTNYRTMTTPGGGQAIVVPNGNGTSTVIHSDGRIETIPTPK